ncbi:MFS transporter [Haloplanus halophilus]|uniref:MFS transporter n=1 Tax=Haloplanus halophilus TaxID=2949993 RepID=UPI00203E40DB|nr:MFS transporter [Haloplanus sp. GDY1]
MSDRWLYAWGLVSLGLGGASLIVPLYVVELGGGPATLGVLAAAAAVAGAPGALGMGWLSDRTGRRRSYVLAAVGVVTVSLAAVPLLSSIAAVVVANAAVWLAFAAAVPVLTLLVVVDEPEAAWSDRIARLNEGQGIGWALGLLVGFLVLVAGDRLGLSAADAQRAVCLACAASAGAGGLLAARSLPADGRPGRDPAPRRLRRAIRDASRFGVRGAGFPFTPRRMDTRGLHPRRFVRRFTPELAVFFTAVTLVFAGFGAFFAPLPVYLASVGVGDGGVFGLYLALNVAAAACFGAAATLTARYEATLVHAGGLAIRGVAFPVVALSGGLLAPVVLLFVVIGVSWALVAVSAGTLVTRLSPPIVRGEALGVYSAVSTLSSGVGSVVGGWVAASGYVRTFGVAGGAVLVGATVVLFLRRRVARRSATNAERTVYSTDRTE